MTPFDDFMYLINSVLLGEEPTVEDFILLVGTFVAFVAFVLWCCFPVVPKEGNGGGSSGADGGGSEPPRQYDPRAGIRVHGHGHGSWWGGRRGRSAGGHALSPVFRRYEPLPLS
ncbi:uncharacterized protein LOC126295186 isoform X1 [Schistocerca gregaria]|uniref:uncharacterized protein LOC126295186 isoform X1 n=1 Tax=Schistocerca gregaria TaxID=7010 RepID=UPI00211E5C45|nr:uncharacterized protein LOC126295186 isoform X1 [Schistocerca gregaria]